MKKGWIVFLLIQCVVVLVMAPYYSALTVRLIRDAKRLARHDPDNPESPIETAKAVPPTPKVIVEAHRLPPNASSAEIMADVRERQRAEKREETVLAAHSKITRWITGIFPRLEKKRGGHQVTRSLDAISHQLDTFVDELMGEKNTKPLPKN